MLACIALTFLLKLRPYPVGGGGVRLLCNYLCPCIWHMLDPMTPTMRPQTAVLLPHDL